ncbi:MAG: hypothetical protein IPK83_09020 [Planctomycetes bacterium]|nr:hypothetical protein [Planctomycetota bacterium]
MADHRPSSKVHSITLGAILAWLVPGLGHWWIGERQRAVIFFIVISVTFWGGIAVGGVRSAVTAKENGLWIAAQLCTGPQSLFALSVSRNLEDEARRDPSKQFKAHGRPGTSAWSMRALPVCSTCLSFLMSCPARTPYATPLLQRQTRERRCVDPMMLANILHDLFIEPKIITGQGRLLMLLPLAMSISIVYKTIRCQKLSAVPLASLSLCITIVVGMLLVGAALLLTYEFLA